MGTPKLRIVFYEDEEGTAQSYFHLEKTEALRVIEILKILPELDRWTPVSKISEMINAKLPATLWVIQKMAGALRIDVNTPEGIETLASRPVLLVRKKQFNTRNNLKKQKYLKPTVYIKAHFRK